VVSGAPSALKKAAAPVPVPVGPGYRFHRPWELHAAMGMPFAATRDSRVQRGWAQPAGPVKRTLAARRAGLTTP
jgi:hypothetical protein